MGSDFIPCAIAVTSSIQWLFLTQPVRDYANTISKKLTPLLSPQPPFGRGALVDAYGTAFSLRCVAPVDRNGIT